METSSVPSVPTLTLKEQQRTLSAKGRKKKSVRHLLAIPYESFWPVLETDKRQELENLFKTLFPAARLTKLDLPWRCLKGKSREERRQMKLAKQKKEDIHCDVRRNLRNHLKLGVNAVTRSLETGSIAAVVLASDVDPIFLNRHVAQLCGVRGVPVVALPTLQEYTRSHLGISCIAMGLKMSVLEPSNHFHKMLLTIKDLSQTFKHSNIVKIFRNPYLSKVQIPNLPTVTNVDIEAKSDTESETDTPSSDTQEATKKTEASDVYLYRTCRTERMFVPEIVSAPAPVEEEETAPTKEENVKKLPEFMALGSSSSDSESDSDMPSGISLRYQHNDNQQSSHFVPAQIRRVRPNPAKGK